MDFLTCSWVLKRNQRTISLIKKKTHLRVQAKCMIYNACVGSPKVKVKVKVGSPKV
jgi:hypothetical protein